MATSIINSGEHKKELTKDKMNHIFRDNMVLRKIYDEHIKTVLDASFDEYINPPYGWDEALSDW
jgi:hypothetical protein